jgi:DNA-directed RNA polymerase subunit M/transcription elongation factor TFIIS
MTSRGKKVASLKDVDVSKMTEEERLKLYEHWFVKSVHNKEVPSIDQFDMWNTPMDIEVRMEEREIIKALTENTNLVTMNNNPCKACGNKKYYVRIVQTRGLDEGATTIYYCSQCSKQTRINA